MGTQQELLRELHLQLGPVAENLAATSFPLSQAAAPLSGLTVGRAPPVESIPLATQVARNALPVSEAAPTVAWFALTAASLSAPV